jgi:hypothetical protein
VDGSDQDKPSYEEILNGWTSILGEAATQKKRGRPPK